MTCATSRLSFEQRSFLEYISICGYLELHRGRRPLGGAGLRAYLEDLGLPYSAPSLSRSIRRLLQRGLIADRVCEVESFRSCREITLTETGQRYVDGLTERYWLRVDSLNRDTTP